MVRSIASRRSEFLTSNLKVRICLEKPGRLLQMGGLLKDFCTDRLSESENDNYNLYVLHVSQTNTI